ncbi:MAG: DNA-formamidopyrimidine glycosylase family protein [Xanthomonadales bacterium]|nr:DNA-formamidopyrimidine glycosylase family protein [Xanthomonadales bacterium]
MPEGDTIHKIANFLAPVLTGREVRALDVARPAVNRVMAGRRITDVAARGKHLFIAFDNRLALRSHLGMYGSWHHYPPGAEWRKPASQASVVLETAERVYVCFNAKDVEWVRSPSVRERVLDMRLGPDLTAGTADVGRLPARSRALLEPDAPLVDVFLDQRVACGIGNVYKSELLFIQRLAPLQHLGDTPDDVLADTYRLASDLLQRNLGGGKRVTRFERDGAGRLWVYGRSGSPCLRCDGPIHSARLGQHHRGTYWCPVCQSTDAQARKLPT